MGAGGRADRRRPHPHHGAPPAGTLSKEALPNVDAIADWTNFYRNVMDVVDGKAELIVKPAEVMRVMKIMECCFASNEQGVSLKVRI